MKRCAFLFPGQGSQAVGMARDLYEHSEVARRLFDRAEKALRLPLKQWCFSGPEEALRQTAATQPAIFVHSIAVWRLLGEAGLEPECVAGHSLGEYSALVAAGVLDFDAGLELVKERSRLMQQAAEKQRGGMAAVLGLEDEQVEGLCLRVAGGQVVVANFNAPGQVVVSGQVEAVARLGLLAREAGARRVVELAVGGAFHSALMQPAAVPMRTLLEEAEFARPKVPVITNVSALPVADAEELRRQLIRQMTHPVRWAESMRCLLGMGVRRAVEAGPGAVLKALGRRNARGLEIYAAGTTEGMAAALAALEGED